MNRGLTLVALFLTITAAGCIDSGEETFLQEFNESQQLELSNENFTLVVNRSSGKYNSSMRLPYDRQELHKVPGSLGNALDSHATQYCQAFQEQFFSETERKLDLEDASRNVKVTNPETGEVLDENYPLKQSEAFSFMQSYQPDQISMEFYDLETGKTTRKCTLTGTGPDSMEADFELPDAGNTL